MRVVTGFKLGSGHDTRDLLPTAYRLLPTVLAALLLLSACASGPPEPATLDTANETCARCRMAVSDRRFAAQVVAPGEEPRFFDDLGCLREYLAAPETRVPADVVVFVADHRTSEWVDARRAVFSRRPGLSTPMASGLMAHRDTSSVREDPEAAGGVPVAAAEVLAGRGAGGGGR